MFTIASIVSGALATLWPAAATPPAMINMPMIFPRM